MLATMRVGQGKIRYQFARWTRIIVKGPRRHLIDCTFWVRSVRFDYFYKIDDAP